MTAPRALWQRYLRPESYADAVLRVVLSFAVSTAVLWPLLRQLTVVLACTLVPALVLLLSGVKRVRDQQHESSRDG